MDTLILYTYIIHYFRANNDRLWGDLTDTLAKQASLMRGPYPVLLFSKLNEMFFGYFDLENIFVDNENK